VKIELSRIPLEGLTLAEELNPQVLDLDTEIVKFRGPIRAKAGVWRIADVIMAQLSLTAVMYAQCSRCLGEFETDLRKVVTLNFSTEDLGKVLDLDPEIREEIMLDYPLKPLCKEDCKGLCARCGKNLNEGGCSCGTT
jgi:uncharacterized protein